MKFSVQRRSHPNLPKYPKDDFTYANTFAIEMQKELGTFCKSVILVGSAARSETMHAHDVDVLIIIDDLTSILTPEVIESYRVITEMTAARISKRIHITTMKLTNFWDYVRHGDPIAVNMLRDGVPLYDVGIFEPAQQLLFTGRIKPTKEAVWNYMARSPITMQNADWHVTQAVLDLYWAVIDAAHAALMKYGCIPETPVHVSDLIMSTLVKKKLCSSNEAKTMDFFYKLGKKITHREISQCSGKEYDGYKKMAHDFIEAMRKIVKSN